MNSGGLRGCLATHPDPPYRSDTTIYFFLGWWGDKERSKSPCLPLYERGTKGRGKESLKRQSLFGREGMGRKTLGGEVDKISI